MIEKLMEYLAEVSGQNIRVTRYLTPLSTQRFVVECLPNGYEEQDHDLADALLRCIQYYSAPRAS